MQIARQASALKPARKAVPHQLHGRVTYDVEQGTCRVFPATRNVRDAR